MSFHHKHPLPLPPQLSFNASEGECAQLCPIRQCPLRGMDDLGIERVGWRGWVIRSIRSFKNPTGLVN
jgi:hypothetical protein